ncbi:unnamed protein product [Caenorhabditis brenneri]
MTIKSKSKTGKSSPWKSKEKTGSKPKTPKPAKNPGNGSSSGKGKTFLKKHAFTIILGVMILALLVALLLLLFLPKTTICTTPECITLAHQLHNFANKSVDPCQDFYKYSCGKYNEHSTQQGPLVKKTVIAAGLIREYLVKTKFTQSRSEQAMKIFYDKCVESRPLDQNQKSIHETANFQSIYQKIKAMGGWPMMGDGQWDPNNFDLNKLLVQTAHSTEVPGEIDMGMFTFNVIGARKLSIYFINALSKEKNYHAFEGFIKLCNLNGVQVNKQHFENSFNRMQSVKDSFKKLVPEKTQPPFDKPILRYPELQKHIKEIDFGYVIENVQSSNKKFFGDILKRTTTLNLPPFSDQSGQIDNMIRNAKEEITNWLIFSYFNSAMMKLEMFESRKMPCEFVLMEFLPHASLRVFVRNFFKKENMKPVSDLVEDTKKSVIEMFEASDWIHEKTKQGAIKKVKNMGKLIGYPEDMEAQGALDKTFHLNINEKTVPFELLSQIEQRSMRLSMGYAASEYNIDPATLKMQTNAFYSPPANALTVLVPFMDDPMFDHSYPQYAKIASIGFILGHEIGHGFDAQGMSFDENGDYRRWFSPEDEKPYETRATCLINQYDSYDDPYFGKNLKGQTTLNENIADDIAAEVTWRTFQNSNPSSQPKIIGFEDYDLNKLYFQIIAMNWCEPRPTHSLQQQLGIKHATNSFRINGVMSNMKQFAETFNCPAGSPMNPEKKCGMF